MSSILITFALLVFVGGVAYAADATDGLGASVTGQRVFEMTVTSGDVSIDAPSDLGPSSTEFSGTIDITLLDNAFQPTTDEVYSKIKLLSLTDNQSQYGTDNVYYLQLGAMQLYAIDSAHDWNGSADFTYPWTLATVGEEINAATCTAPATDGQKTLGASYHIPVYLVINDGKRLYGDTADSLVIQFTAVDTAN